VANAARAIVKSRRKVAENDSDIAQGTKVETGWEAPATMTPYTFTGASSMSIPYLGI
jgi:hypothetical protein